MNNQRILMVTEFPNSAASVLKIEEIYDIIKSPFCQYFGRILFGYEKDYRKYFNINNIKWMHANGSKLYDNEALDGKAAINEEILSNKYKILITFGIPAARVIFPDVDISRLSNVMKNGQVEIKELNRAYAKVETMYFGFPHVSGQAQQFWMKNSVAYSDLIILLQKEVEKILNKAFYE